MRASCHPKLLGKGKAIDLAKGVIDLSARDPAVERQREPIAASTPGTIRVGLQKRCLWPL